jgi:hypothetical protein
MYWKMDKTVHIKAVLAFNLHFQVKGLNLQENKSAPFEKALNSGLKTPLRIKSLICTYFRT